MVDSLASPSSASPYPEEGLAGESIQMVLNEDATLFSRT